MAIKLISTKDILRAAQPQVAKVKRDLVSALRDATPVDTGNARDSWKVTPTGISNDADYIDELNAGSSQQAPSHFIEQTVLANPFVKPNGFIVRSE